MRIKRTMSKLKSSKQVNRLLSVIFDFFLGFFDLPAVCLRSSIILNIAVKPADIQAVVIAAVHIVYFRFISNHIRHILVLVVDVFDWLLIKINIRICVLLCGATTTVPGLDGLCLLVGIVMIKILGRFAALKVDILFIMGTKHLFCDHVNSTFFIINDAFRSRLRVFNIETLETFLHGVL